DAVEAEERLDNFYRFKKTVLQRFPDILWINPKKVICDDSRCQTVLNGIPLYRDESHLNHVGSTEIGRLYLERFGNPLPKSP
ncbi:MAG: acyltransferase, partial [Alcanivorax sp.]|nr:acyltransferase [Alcanivorax sp.]